MARTEIGAFEKELGDLCRKHLVHPAVIVYHPGGTEGNRFDVTEIGFPSTEWVAQSGEAYLQHAERKIMGGKTYSAIEKEPEDIKSRREENFTKSGLIGKLMKGAKKIHIPGTGA